MGNQTASILKGFDYQHLLSWHYILSLKIPKYHVTKVKLEDSQAGSIDDVTVYKESIQTIDFYQIKYHVDNRDCYTIDNLINAASGNSLMEKFWITWKKIIKNNPNENITLNLYSNWLIDPSDHILTCINNEKGCFTDSFYTAEITTDCGKKREEWRNKHSATEQEFNAFTKSLVFHLGRSFTEELKQMISDRMDLLKIKSDENSLLIACGIIKDWIKSGVQEVTLDILEQKIKQHDLYLPANSENGVAIYFVTIKNHKFDIEPDYILDWKKYFETISGKGDHTLINPNGWNERLLPEIIELESKVSNETASRLIKARGFSRLSPWFAFGFIFSEVADYKIEVEQQGSNWRTDVRPNSDFKIRSENGEGESFKTATKTVAVGLSITGSLNEAVREYIKVNQAADELLLLRPERELNKYCLRDAGDVNALAILSKERIRDFVWKHKAERLLLFYFGPLSGACFIGHQLNAICKEIQIMENIGTTYFPSFLLR